MTSDADAVIPRRVARKVRLPILRVSAAHRLRRELGEAFYDFAFCFLPQAAFVPCSALYCPFPPVKPQLFLDAISLQIFVYRGD